MSQGIEFLNIDSMNKTADGFVLLLGEAVTIKYDIYIHKQNQASDNAIIHDLTTGLFCL